MLLASLDLFTFQMWNVTKYIYSSTELNDKFEVLYLNIYILCKCILLLNYISEVNIVLLTPLHTSDSCSYFSDYNFSQYCSPLETMYLQIYRLRMWMLMIV